MHYIGGRSAGLEGPGAEMSKIFVPSRNPDGVHHGVFKSIVPRGTTLWGAVERTFGIFFVREEV